MCPPWTYKKNPGYGFICNFRILSPSPEPIRYLFKTSNKPYQRYSHDSLAQMLTSTMQCAEAMSPLCRFKVKVTLEGQMSDRSNVRQVHVRSINHLPLEAIASNDKSRMRNKHGIFTKTHVGKTP